MEKNIEKEEIEKPKLGKVILNIKEKPKMSEEKKNKLIKRMNTAMEIQKIKNRNGKSI